VLCLYFANVRGILDEVGLSVSQRVRIMQALKTHSMEGGKEKAKNVNAKDDIMLAEGDDNDDMYHVPNVTEGDATTK